MNATKRKIKKHGNERWEVDFGLVNGKRLRPSFVSEKLADKAIEKWEGERKRQGDMWLSLPIEERQAIMATVAAIRLAGHTVMEVWDGYRAWEKERSAKPLITSVPYAEAVESLEKAKDKSGKDSRYVQETAGLLLKFADGQTERLISSFTANELETWINSQKWGLSTRKSNMGRFSSLWTHALNKQWVTENIVDRLEKVGKIVVNPEKFDNSTCLKLLAWSLANDDHKRVIAPLVLGMFCGMRPEEIDHPDFGWHLIDLKQGQITVPGQVAKDGDRRYTSILPTAKLWLKLAFELKNPMPPVNERKLIDSICDMAGVKTWPHDVLRKTAATHLYSHYQDAGRVVMELGNSIRILLKHYVAMARDEESKEFWGFTPEIALKELARLKSRPTPSTQSASETATTSD